MSPPEGSSEQHTDFFARVERIAVLTERLWKLGAAVLCGIFAITVAWVTLKADVSANTTDIAENRKANHSTVLLIDSLHPRKRGGDTE